MALWVLLALAFVGTAQAGNAASDVDRLGALRQAGTSASLTVYPFVLGEQPLAEVGAVVGVMMEQSGLADVGTDETVFRPAEDADLGQIAEAFGSFVRKEEISRQYALYGEYLGSRAAGITEIRAVLVDREGNVVWVERQAPGDADFDRANPRNPMECCVFLAERLKQTMALPDIPAGAERKAGKLERELAGSAGVPEESEFEAMEKRQEVFANRHAAASIEIYPVRIGGELSGEEAQRLSEMLDKNGFRRTKVAGTALPIEVQPARNEQKMLWTLARKFQDHVRAHPPQADYVLYADYIMRQPDGPVGAVHLVVCDREGEWVVVDFQNSHHEDFREVAPRNSEGCGRLAAKRLTGYVH
jgi:hypothetical protein